MTDEFIDSNGYPPDWSSLVKKVKIDVGLLTVGHAIAAIRKVLKVKTDFGGTRHTQAEFLYSKTKQRYPTYQKLLEALE